MIKLTDPKGNRVTKPADITEIISRLFPLERQHANFGQLNHAQRVLGVWELSKVSCEVRVEQVAMYDVFTKAPAWLIKWAHAHNLNLFRHLLM